MADAGIIEWIRVKYAGFSARLDERGRRLWAASEARSLGRGGIAAVSAATGISDRTIRSGIAELDSPDALSDGRQRCPGAGRPSREAERPDLVAALESLVDPSARGDPQSPLRWTVRSTRGLAEVLQERGFAVSSTKVGQLLRARGYSLQSHRKAVEGKQHPDRDAQFHFIARRVKSYRRSGEPAVSVDAKKKETLGNLENPGRTYRKKGDPQRVRTHDFPDPELGKAVPYGVYDIARNEAGVSVGIGPDTAEFAVAAIARWWSRLGRKRYPSGRRLLVTADCGGSNSPRTRLWRWALQRFANASGLAVEVCHYPPGTSKWNKIEHRLFCHITRTWSGVPLETLEIVVSLIGSTTTGEGLEVHAWLDEREYEKSKEVTDQQLAEVAIQRNKFHGEWNYTVIPNKKSFR